MWAVFKRTTQASLTWATLPFLIKKKLTKGVTLTRIAKGMTVKSMLMETQPPNGSQQMTCENRVMLAQLRRFSHPKTAITITAAWLQLQASV